MATLPTGVVSVTNSEVDVKREPPMNYDFGKNWLEVVMPHLQWSRLNCVLERVYAQIKDEWPFPSHFTNASYDFKRPPSCQFGKGCSCLELRKDILETYFTVDAFKLLIANCPPDEKAASLELWDKMQQADEKMDENLMYCLQQSRILRRV